MSELERNERIEAAFNRSVDEDLLSQSKVKEIKVGMKVRELSTGRLCRFVLTKDNDAYVLDGEKLRVFSETSFWKLFEEVQS